MNRAGRWRLALALLLGAPALAAAQQPVPPAPAPAPAPTPTPAPTPRAEPPRPGLAPPDSTFPADSLPPDSLSVNTAEYLEGRRLAATRLAAQPLLGADGPQPPDARIVFGRDSLDWQLAQTVSDLMMRVPGAYVWRGGWLGRPEPINYHARGAAGVEYLVDGLPYIPMGVDSVGVDAALLPLHLLERVEVERWPGFLRVKLFTRRHERAAPASRLGFLRGQEGITRYVGGLEKRSASGVGLTLGADYLNVQSRPANSDNNRFTDTRLLAQVGWMPNARRGVVATLLRTSPEQRVFRSGADTIGAGFAGERSELTLRAFRRARADGMGPGVDAFLVRSTWASDSGARPELEQRLYQAGAVGSWRSPTAHAAASLFWRSRWTPLDARVDGSVIRGRLLLAGEGSVRRHTGGRQSVVGGLRASVSLGTGTALTGTARVGSVVVAPAIETDTAQALQDLGLAFTWTRERLGLELSLARTGEWQPIPFQQFPGIPLIRGTSGTTWLTAKGRLAPLRWLTLEGWVTTPRPFAPDGQPPTHSVSMATIRTKFWRTFPSGAMDVKLQLAVENWYPGSLGLDRQGQGLALPRATYTRGSVQVKLTSFTLIWDQYNLAGMTVPYVAGFPIPAYAWTIGARWEFSN
ncbi:MAG: Plug domain-containing protein [Gemmatimonadales bacterium]|nr:Plug domain-containing protein [Gemmatimonadales bacterium]